MKVAGQAEKLAEQAVDDLVGDSGGRFVSGKRAWIDFGRRWFVRMRAIVAKETHFTTATREFDWSSRKSARVSRLLRRGQPPGAPSHV